MKKMSYTWVFRLFEVVRRVFQNVLRNSLACCTVSPAFKLEMAAVSQAITNRNQRPDRGAPGRQPMTEKAVWKRLSRLRLCRNMVAGLRGLGVPCCSGVLSCVAVPLCRGLAAQPHRTDVPTSNTNWERKRGHLRYSISWQSRGF